MNNEYVDTESKSRESERDPLEGNEDLQKALLDITHSFDILEESNRLANVRLYRKCENYWHHIQDNYWSTEFSGFRSPELFIRENPETNEVLDYEEMKYVNMFRAHGDSITAALSVGTPTIRFFPEDADNPEDISTSKSKSKVVKLIERHNKAKLLLIRAIYILFNQGFVAAHNYSHESKSYGVSEVPEYDEKDVHFTTLYCSSCADELQKLGPFTEEQDNTVNEMPMVCPTCKSEGIPEVVNETEPVKYIKDYKESPKCRQKIDMWGPLNVKISSYAKEQKQVGILILDEEIPIAQAQETYPNIAGKIKNGPLNQEVSVLARMPNNVFDSYFRGYVTCRKIWMRPWYFNEFCKGTDPLKDPIVVELKKKFPRGICFHAINDVYAESYAEDMDDAWSFSFNPSSHFIHSDPIGQPLIPLQDTKNEMHNLQLESIEFGVPEQFVDSEILNMEAYRKARGGPGMTFPVKPQIPGADISKSFYVNKQSTLSDEAGRFESRIDADAQFISGDYPSIYGGPNSGDTAAEYNMSRQQALQRLSLTWTIVSFLWADIMDKSVSGYIKNLKEDERYVEKEGNDFINIWIKLDELKGRTGEVYPEGSEQFPTSWAQQRELLIQFLQNPNPMIEAVLADPNNRSEIPTLIGLPNLKVPGDVDRQKQLNEISMLIQSEPAGENIPSVMPEEKVDDHEIHIACCKYWLNSETGQYFKIEKPAAYMNVVLHMEAHMMMQQEEMMGAIPNENQANPNNSGNPNSESSGGAESGQPTSTE